MQITPIQIRFTDVDSFHHVNNSVYQSYFDVARIEYFKQIKLGNFDTQDETVVIVHIEVDYKAETTFRNQIEIHTSVVQIGNRSLRMQQDVVNKETGAAHVSCLSILSGFNRKTKQSIPILKEWRDAIEHFEGKKF